MLSPRLDRRPRFAIRFPALDRLALVVVLLAFGQADSHFHAAVLEVQPDGDERHAPLDGLTDQFTDLVAVEKELPPAQRLVIGRSAVAVRTDVDVVQKHLSVLDARKAVAEV